MFSYIFRCETFPTISEGCVLQRIDECCSELVCQTTKNITVVLNDQAPSNITGETAIKLEAFTVVTKEITGKNITDSVTKPIDTANVVKDDKVVITKQSIAEPIINIVDASIKHVTFETATGDVKQGKNLVSGTKSKWAQLLQFYPNLNYISLHVKWLIHIRLNSRLN